MHQISDARFNILAGYTRLPGADLFGREFAWFESTSGQVLALLIVDTDFEYSGILFARDLSERFRWVGQTDFFSTLAEAAEALADKAAVTEVDIDKIRVQGDEAAAMDFFETVPGRALHARYVYLSSDPAWRPARDVIANIMRWYEDGDGNFVEQFQTEGFDPRIWEVYLFAMLVENGYSVTHPSPAPDFLAESIGRRFTVEATTVNPSVIGGKPTPSQKPTSKDQLDDYLENYLPIRYAGPLTAKLSKKYWTKPDASGHPLLFAIQDFHDSLTMTYSGQALQTYLFGQRLRIEEEAGADANHRIEKVDWHVWGTKRLPSGFFNLPEAEHVSAVLFNGAGTLAKFNRIGVATGFDSSEVKLVHHGARFNPLDPTRPLEFQVEVTDGIEETWSDGLWVFHNPRALLPFNPEWLPSAAHVHWDGTQLNAMIPHGHLDSSVTTVIRVSHG